MYRIDHYRNLVNEKDNLSERQREVLQTLLSCDSYFLSFCFDSDWDYVYTQSKVVLVTLMLKGDWDFHSFTSYMEDDIYAVTIDFEKTFLIAEVVISQLRRDKRKKAHSIELYLPHHDFLEIFK